MKISSKDLVRLIVEADKQGYNQAIKHSDLAYDEYAADFRKAMDEQRTMTEEAFDRGFKAAQGDYQAGLDQGRREALSDEALASAKSQAYEVGYKKGLGDGETHAASQAYEAGYKKGVEDQGRKTLELMAEAAEPKLSVWFMSCGKNKFEMQDGAPVLVSKSYSPTKIDGIRAIREVYGSGEGYSLKEVKALVEIEPGTFVSCGEPLPQAKAVELYLRLRAVGFEVVLRKS